MNKITFEDLPSKRTPINAENLNLMQDNIETVVNENAEEIENLNNKKSAITAYMSTSQTIAPDTQTTLLLDTINAKVGIDLALENNMIVCKRDGVVEISGNFHIGSLKAGGNTIPRIRKNSTDILQCPTRVSYSNDQAFTLAPKVQEVKSGDTIYMQLGNWSGQDNVVNSGQHCTYITVKYID